MLSFKQYLIESLPHVPPDEFPGIDQNQWANPYSNEPSPPVLKWRGFDLYAPFRSPILTGGDADGDGQPDGNEDIEYPPLEDFDDDNDGVLNAEDMDDDGDNIPDWVDQDWLDNYPSLAKEPYYFKDPDGDGIPDLWDDDD